MGKIKRVTIVFAAAIAIFFAAHFLLCTVASLTQGYSWTEMDWPQRGYTSIGDFFAARDIGKREIVRRGEKCTEYYAYKDGLPVKTVCLPEK